MPPSPLNDAPFPLPYKHPLFNRLRPRDNYIRRKETEKEKNDVINLGLWETVHLPLPQSNI